MTTENDLSRFLDAQDGAYELALAEIQNGKKQNHWMWYVFPQIDGLGSSPTTQYYAIKGIEEAKHYLNHPILGVRLLEITTELINLNLSNPIVIFGDIDSLKLKSSMTLFSLVENTNPIFQKVLDKFFDGKKDSKTVSLSYSDTAG